MTEDVLKMNLGHIRSELQVAIAECTERGLIKNAKWLAEINFGLREVPLEECGTHEPVPEPERTNYLLAKSYFDCGEFDRAASFVENCTNHKARFIYLYSKYMSAEKKWQDNLKESTLNEQNNAIHQDLFNKLKVARETGKLDGYGLYLYGIVLKKLQLTSLAVDILLEAITRVPTLWGAWLELAPLINDRTHLNSLKLPDHWIRPFFLVRTHLERVSEMNEQAVEILEALQENGFSKCTDVTAQMAVAHHNQREVDKALDVFRTLRTADPYRLDNLDIYSNLLYVKELRTELANLAHASVDIDKYRVETCCVIGNYYSMRSEHQKAVLYFQRALRLNPNFLSAWTLMGHEFMELKNTSAAIHSYRSAIEVSHRDYRAWYGLGQTYEILKMPFYSLYYYKEAQQLRPNDSRMLIALGETFERLDRCENALKCYFKACNVGDIEGMALLKSAKLYEKLGAKDNAAAAYSELCMDECRTLVDKTELHAAYKFLANYHASLNQIDMASHYAYKCLEHDETKNEGKALLKMVACKRAEIELGEAGNANLQEVTMDEETDENIIIE